MGRCVRHEHGADQARAPPAGGCGDTGGASAATTGAGQGQGAGEGAGGLLARGTGTEVLARTSQVNPQPPSLPTCPIRCLSVSLSVCLHRFCTAVRYTRALSTGVGEAQWQQKLSDLARKEKRRAKEKERGGAPPSPAPSASNSSRPRSGAHMHHVGGQQQQKQRQRSEEEADEADKHRKERVARMTRELPLMSITELRRMMNAW